LYGRHAPIELLPAVPHDGHNIGQIQQRQAARPAPNPAALPDRYEVAEGPEEIDRPLRPDERLDQFPADLFGLERRRGHQDLRVGRDTGGGDSRQAQEDLRHLPDMSVDEYGAVRALQIPCEFGFAAHPGQFLVWLDIFALPVRAVKQRDDVHVPGVELGPEDVSASDEEVVRLVLAIGERHAQPPAQPFGGRAAIQLGPAPREQHERPEPPR